MKSIPAKNLFEYFKYRKGYRGGRKVRKGMDVYSHGGVHGSWLTRADGVWLMAYGAAMVFGKMEVCSRELSMVDGPLSMADKGLMANGVWRMARQRLLVSWTFISAQGS